jgi:outer membrane protein assembly factor BamB
LRTRPLFVLCALMTAVMAAGPASATVGTSDPWPQFQGGPGRAGDASLAPAPPYRVSWQADAGIGDPSHLSGYPTPILAGPLAIIVGPQEVTAVQASDGASAWALPRLIGPSSPPAVVGTTLLYLEGGGDESASASNSPTSPPPSPAPSATASPGASASPGATAASVSTLVAVDLSDQKRLWTATLSDVSHTGVLSVGDVAVVGTDDGQVSAFSVADGKQVWSVHAGDQVIAPMAASTDLVLASVRPNGNGTPLLLALNAADGSEAWRYDPPNSVLDLGGPSVSGDSVFFVASDASVRAVALTDGTQEWASPLYTPTVGSPPVVTDAGLFVTDQSGTVYAMDPATGAERWRFATNLGVVGAPVATSTAVLQPAIDGSIVAIGIESGHQIWHASIADNVVLGLAASSSAIVASHSGTAPGLVALVTDPSGALEDVSSPTTADPAGLASGWLLAALPLVVVLVLVGRWLDRRMGRADLGVPDDVVDPWETDLEDGS